MKTVCYLPVDCVDVTVLVVNGVVPIVLTVVPFVIGVVTAAVPSESK